MRQRQAVTKKMATAYKRANRPEKSRICDQVVGLTGWHRDDARAALRDAPRFKVAKPPTPKAAKFGPHLIACSTIWWMLTRTPAGKRLAPERAKWFPRGRSHTKPGTLLKSQIPVRTWAEWSENVPGFVEIDLVGHEGGNSTGEFCFTLTVTITVTDIATGWTINRSIKNKAAIWVFEAIEHVLAQFPFPILGIDSDNRSEFINHHLFNYCNEHKITFTRSRPGNKNDGAHVEQKNWTHVRELVGSLRFDTEAERKIPDEIWELDRTSTKDLLAQQKLVSKVPSGAKVAKVTKRHDRAATPFERASARGDLSGAARATMGEVMVAIRPGDLYRAIEELTTRLERIALAKAPAPVKPPVNRAFNSSLHPEVFAEATNRASRRD